MSCQMKVFWWNLEAALAGGEFTCTSRGPAFSGTLTDGRHEAHLKMLLQTPSFYDTCMCGGTDILMLS